MFYLIFPAIAVVYTLAVMRGVSPGMVILAVLNAIFMFLLTYLTLPTLSFGYSDVLVMALVMMVIPAVASFVLMLDKGEESAPMGFFILIGFVVLWAVGSFFASSEMVNADRYAKLIGTVEEKEKPVDLNNGLTAVDIHNVRLAPPENGALKVSQALGNDAGLGSRVTVGEKTSSRLNGCFTARLIDKSVKKLCFNNELVDVAALEYSGFNVWRLNNGTPGYTISSAINPEKFYVVTGLQAADGTVADIQLRYLPSAFFWDNLYRYVYTHGYATVGYTEPSFEIDDTGRPFYVLSKYENMVGYGGRQATGIILVDPENGDIKEYGLDNVPAWIDRVQPTEFQLEQLEWWAQYAAQGYWNSTWYGGKQGVQTTTEGSAVVEGSDGELYVYSGMKSVGSDNSTSGFIMMSPRTNKVTYYHFGGATETSAQYSAEHSGLAFLNGLHAAFPVMYKINGVPSYFMPMLDGNHGVKAYVFMKVSQREILGAGTTWQDALQNYQDKLISRSDAVDVTNESDMVSLVAKVLDITTEQRADTLMYFLILDGLKGQEATAPANLSRELKWTKVGDEVVVKLKNNSTNSVPIVLFDNQRVDVK